MFNFSFVKYKAVSLVLVLLFALSALCACSSATDEEKVVGKVGEFDVYYDELYFLASSYKVGLEAKYGEYAKLDAASAKRFDEELRELVYPYSMDRFYGLTIEDGNDHIFALVKSAEGAE